MSDIRAKKVKKEIKKITSSLNVLHYNIRNFFSQTDEPIHPVTFVEPISIVDVPGGHGEHRRSS